MRKSKPIILYLPDLLIEELDKYLIDNPPNFKYHKVFFYYVVHQMTVMQIQYKNEKYFTLNKKYLMTITSSNIDRYIKILANGEFIISDNSYQRGVKSLKYKLNPKFISDVCKIELKSDSKIGEKIVKNLNRKKAHYNRLEPHLKLMKEEFMNVELDYEKATEWVLNNATDSQKLNYLTSLNHLEDSRFRYFKRNKTNRRLDTNLTNFKSDLRQFIKGDYVSIDLKNSQLFLLAILQDSIIYKRDTLCCYLHTDRLLKTFGIKKIRAISKIHQKQEKARMVNFRMFFNAVKNGVLYEEFIELFKGVITRKEVKKLMFKILFSRNEYYSRYKKIIPYESDKRLFRSVYPSVADAVKALKEKDHTKLPIYLQRLESYLFIDCIAKELVRNGIIPLTIHDSVIVRECDQEKAMEIVKRVFKKELGAVPSFKITKL